ncbi:hypothetical protein [Ilumatobacter coccineus]|jgi:hypothetical protein|uniref:Uncharacterized protein n=1 Tax=Ilumatobacter coccineus (strain NBRC 103263 / KCTC 29153 / YM16-304) TaxID=1313172 RepID=A0A6C7E9U5_ILUCY|nr:hypothetical protein [Ilumatobacter coccineus]BAN04434.1 hypothetical protein YM304_41200 [Ilumatobacter coccineus YM16-304]
MSDLPEVPQFGALLRGHISSVPDEARPVFLSGLERSAAERYRQWAEQLPEYADELLGCARREDEIAELVADLFPVSAELQQQVDEAMPAAVALYYEVFAPHPPLHQLYLQSEAELQGAMAWVGMAEAVTDDATRSTLERCTALERESSVVVKQLLDGVLT